jgi:hypothetical protein
MALSLYLARLLLGAQESERDQSSAAVILVLSAVGLSFSLNFIALAVTASVICVAYVLRSIDRTARRFSALARLSALPLSILVSWSIRGYLLSGYPFFPVPILGLPFPWRLAQEEVSEIVTVIRAWARTPRVDAHIVMKNWDWVGGWLERIQQYYKLEVLIPAKLIVVISPLALLSMFITEFQANIRRAWIYMLPGAASLTYLFLSAPASRSLLRSDLRWRILSGS